MYSGRDRNDLDIQHFLLSVRFPGSWNTQRCDVISGRRESTSWRISSSRLCQRAFPLLPQTGIVFPLPPDLPSCCVFGRSCRSKEYSSLGLILVESPFLYTLSFTCFKILLDLGIKKWLLVAKPAPLSRKMFYPFLRNKIEPSLKLIHIKAFLQKGMEYNLLLGVTAPFKDFSQIACLAELTRAEILATTFIKPARCIC